MALASGDTMVSKNIAGRLAVRKIAAEMGG